MNTMEQRDLEWARETFAVTCTSAGLRAEDLLRVLAEDLGFELVVREDSC